MTAREKWSTAVMALAIGAFALTMMFTRERPQQAAQTPVSADVLAPALQVSDAQIAAAIREQKLAVDGLQIQRAGDIVLVRGTADPATASQVIAAVRALGVTRVANLMTVGVQFNDDTLRREAERQLASEPGLQGTRLRISVENGILSVEGTVARELQKDVARAALRGVKAREVKIDLKTL